MQLSGTAFALITREGSASGVKMRLVRGRSQAHRGCGMEPVTLFRTLATLTGSATSIVQRLASLGLCSVQRDAWATPLATAASRYLYKNSGARSCLKNRFSSQPLAFARFDEVLEIQHCLRCVRCSESAYSRFEFLTFAQITCDRWVTLPSEHGLEPIYAPFRQPSYEMLFYPKFPVSVLV